MASVSRDQPIRPTAQSRSVAFFYFHPSDQFRPVLSVGLAANQTNAAAGIRIVSHFDPPTRAAVPSTTRTNVKAIDFFEFALILKVLSKLCSQEPLHDFYFGGQPSLLIGNYPYIFS